MKKIVLEIKFEDDSMGNEIRRLLEDFCTGLQEDILPQAECTLEIEGGEDASI